MSKCILTKEQEQKIIYNYEVLKMSQRNSGASIGVGYKTVQKILKKIISILEVKENQGKNIR